MEFVQIPVFWVSGAGTLSGLKLTTTSRVDVEPLDLSRPLPKPGARRPAPPAALGREKGQARTPTGKKKPGKKKGPTS